MALKTTKRIAVLAILAAGTAHIAMGRSPAEEKSPAAVLAADGAWGEAEAKGDAAFVESLLLAGYRSVDASGRPTTKEAIVEGARARAGSPSAAAKIAAWKAAHPLRAEVAIFGDTAVLTWVSLRPKANGAISSSDVFVHQDGHWRAIYSQHAKIPDDG